MGKLDDACKEVVSNVDGAIAAGVVDLETGMLLGVYNASPSRVALNEIVAAGCTDMFRGTSMTRVEQLVRRRRGLPENGDSGGQEVHISSEGSFHFAKTVKSGKAAILLVTKKTTNRGMGWAQLKSAVPVIERLIP